MLVHDPTESRKRPMRIWERRKKSILKASSFIERSTENKKKMVVTWQQRTHCAIKLLCTLCRSPLGFSIVVSFLLSTFSENCTGLHRSQTTNESVFLSNPIEKKKTEQRILRGKWNVCRGWCVAFVLMIFFAKSDAKVKAQAHCQSIDRRQWYKAFHCIDGQYRVTFLKYG